MKGARDQRSWIVGAALVAGGIACLYGARFGGDALVRAGWIGDVSGDDALFLFVAGAIGLLAAACAVGAERAFARRQRAADVVGCEKGVVLAELVLLIPILILLSGTIVQLMLILNASIVVRYAAFSAARTAAVSFDRSATQVHERPRAGLDQDLHDAAVLVTATISPAMGEATHLNQAGGASRDPQNPGGGMGPPTGETDPAGILLSRVFGTNATVYGGRTLNLRRDYARDFTTVSFTDWVPVVPFEFTRMRNVPAAREVRVRVDYDFFLSITGLLILPGLHEALPEGMQGEVFPLSATVEMQTAGSRVHSTGARSGGLPPP